MSIVGTRNFVWYKALFPTLLSAQSIYPSQVFLVAVILPAEIHSLVEVGQPYGLFFLWIKIHAQGRLVE